MKKHLALLLASSTLIASAVITHAMGTSSGKDPRQDHATAVTQASSATAATGGAPVAGRLRADFAPTFFRTTWRVTGTVRVSRRVKRGTVLELRTPTLLRATGRYRDEGRDVNRLGVRVLVSPTALMATGGRRLKPGNRVLVTGKFIKPTRRVQVKNGTPILVVRADQVQVVVPEAPASPGTPSSPPGTSPPAGTTGFPTASNTGVPAGTSLTPYTGPCTITAPNTVIDAKTIACNLSVRAAGVTVTRSKIAGTIINDVNSAGYSFTISDSEIDAGNREGTGIGDVNFTATRVHVRGGNRSIHCENNCTVVDSYVHGQMTDLTGVLHESGIRMGENAVIRHNTITCDAPEVPPDAGCSAGLTGYGDFAPVQNNLIENNLFKASTGAFCAYGGSSGGKPFSSQTKSITFRNNVFERGPGGKCASYGPITAFDTTRPGNVWSGNKWDNGATVPPAM